mgnify:CR=1 FL=1|tara:strand:- start:278 stop:472 length:195 start_codon:yes stop_codon:yes gene_type:complete
MKIQRLERPFICETPADMTKAQFNRLAYFIENMPKRGSVEWVDLQVIGRKLMNIAEDGRRKEDK